MMDIVYYFLEQAEMNLKFDDQQVVTRGMAHAPKYSSCWLPSLLSSLLSVNDVMLGRLILNLGSPEQDYYPEKSQLRDGDVAVSSISDLYQTLRPPDASSFTNRLKDALKLGFKSDKSFWYDLAAPESKTYRLLNAADYFRRLRIQGDTQRWLEASLKYGFNIHLVVGVLTVMNAQISQGSHSLLRSSFHASSLTSHAGVSSVETPLGVSIDLEAGPSVGASYEQFTAKGERVLAIAYRKLRFHMFRTRKAESSYLGNELHWQTYLHGAR